MISRDQSNKRWREVCDAFDADEIDKSLELLKDWESQERLSIEELVYKARAIQLGGEDSVYELGDAKELLLAALGREKNYPVALTELGYFSWAVEDDAGLGLEYFDKAIAVLKEMLGKARDGRQKCLEELEDLAEEGWYRTRAPGKAEPIRLRP